MNLFEYPRLKFFLTMMLTLLATIECQEKCGRRYCNENECCAEPKPGYQSCEESREIGERCSVPPANGYLPRRCSCNKKFSCISGRCRDMTTTEIPATMEMTSPPTTDPE
uniref:U2-Hypotoxin-Hsp1a_1 n=1 Tax=Hypochilus sp. SGP-2016 TaxID=1905178 RepID=A0A482ZAR6_9ARAC